ncbi:hypothetical protein Rs2_15878 [Raphanus sativus]|nr:hypothetical protein Rs2_15878 [Raphanus sativus]
MARILAGRTSVSLNEAAFLLFLDKGLQNVSAQRSSTLVSSITCYSCGIVLPNVSSQRSSTLVSPPSSGFKEEFLRQATPEKGLRTLLMCMVFQELMSSCMLDNTHLTKVCVMFWLLKGFQELMSSCFLMKLIDYYVKEKYTLRYTGGMVPDVNQIIVKEKGIFTIHERDFSNG